MKKSTLVILVLILALVPAVRAQAPKVDLTGEWEVVFETPMGVRTYATTFVQDKEALKVVMKSAQGTELKSEAKVTGNEALWTVIVSGPMGEIALTFRGKVEGPTMAGTVTMGEAGEAEFKAKKLK
jgi:hypothetical protein